MPVASLTTSVTTAHKTMQQHRRTQKKKILLFYENIVSQALANEYSCTPQQTVNMALLVKPNPRLVCEERVHSLEGAWIPAC